MPALLDVPKLDSRTNPIPPDATTFEIFSAQHWVSLVVILVSAVGLVVLARRVRTEKARRRILLALSLTLLVNQILWHAQAVASGDWRLSKHLPLHLCDAATVVNIALPFVRSPLLFELAYFWGLGGAFQALVTPDLVDPFPQVLFWCYFVGHAGLVFLPTILAFGMRQHPRRGAVWRALLATNLLAVVAGSANAAFGGNYMFLREPPPTGSLLDHFGPWPWYIGTCEVVALSLFALLSLPFRKRGEPRSDARTEADVLAS